jgi:hypothetical protein
MVKASYLEIIVQRFRIHLKLQTIAMICIVPILLTSTASCKKEKIWPTQRELTAIELHKVVQANNIQKVLPYKLGQPNSLYELYPGTGDTYTISNGFITFSLIRAGFNLDLLRYYQIEDLLIRDPVPTYYHCLVLYFDFN